MRKAFAALGAVALAATLAACGAPSETARNGEPTRRG